MLYYDNRGDPQDYHIFDHGDELFAWRTHFSSFGVQTGSGNLVLIGQAIAGTTEIAPSEFRSETHFFAAYALAGWNLGAWRPALRVAKCCASTARATSASPRIWRRAR